MNGDWFSRGALGNLALLGATLLVFYLFWLVISPFVAVITWAIAIGVMIRPWFLLLRRWLRNPTVAAVVCVILAGVIILGPGVLLVNQALQEGAGAVALIRDEVESGRLLSHFDRFPSVKESLENALATFDIRAQVQRLAGELANVGRTLVVGSSWFFTQFFITLFALFFAMRDLEQANEALRTLLPLTDDEMDFLLARLSNTISAAIYGKFAAASAQGVLGGLMFAILGIPGPLLWGLLMAVAGLVPMLGPAMIWAPAAAILLYQGMWVKALVLVLWGLFAVGLVDNFVMPLVVGGTLQLHTLLVFFATFGGLIAFGLSGLVLGPIVLALTLALLQIWRDRTSVVTASR